MRILVNGLMAYDAGKTSLLHALLSRADHEGIRMLPFKPRSAHNFWEHYDHSRACENLGLLVSRDILQLSDHLRDPPDLTLLNPYHQLHCPLDPFAEGEGEGSGYPLRDVLLAERVSDPGDGTTLYVNRRSDRTIAPASFLDALEATASHVRPLPEPPVREVQAGAEAALHASFEVLTREDVHVIIESFNDVAWPMALPPEELGLVLTVGASRALVFEPQEVARAVQGLRETTMTGLLPYLQPLQRFRLPLLTTAERGDADLLSESYDEVVEAVWAEFA